jgi:hypothetical protein
VTRRLAARAIASVLLSLWSTTAFADPAPDAPTQSGPFARATVPDDPTGGAYTTPTLLFIPAAAVPTWNVRVITSLDVQGPTAPDRLAVGTPSNGLSTVGFQPGIAGELGLPGGFTFGAGTIWVGGDPNTSPNAAGGLSSERPGHDLGRQCS